MLHPDERRLVLTALRSPYDAGSSFKTVGGHVQYITGTALVRGAPRTWAYFQPSEEVQDWFDDLRSWKVRVADGVNVHAGFHAQFEDVRDQPDLVGKDYYLGHSLGGAIATLCCWANPDSSALVSGCPRVGDAGFARGMTGRRVLRIECGGDPVTHLPPYLCGFRHCGISMYLRGPASWWERILRTKSVHFPASYIAAIESET